MALRFCSLLCSSVNLCLPLTSVNVSSVRNQLSYRCPKLSGFNFSIRLFFIVKLLSPGCDKILLKHLFSLNSVLIVFYNPAAVLIRLVCVLPTLTSDLPGSPEPLNLYSTNQIFL